MNTQIFAVTLVFPLPSGLAVALGRISKNPMICAITKFCISIMRETPLMLQLTVVYFGPYYLFGIKTKSSNFWLWVAFIGPVINYTIYFTETYRSGTQPMLVGQYEAARLSGYSRSQTFFKIILSQVIRRILPSITGEVITLVKDMSLTLTISVIKMLSIVKALASSQASIISFVAIGSFYYIFNLLVAMTMERVGKELSYHQ